MSNIQHMGLIPKKPVNPEAARLANYYVPIILAKMGRSLKSATPELEELANKPLTPFQKQLAKGFEIMLRAQEKEHMRRTLAANGYQPDRLDQQDWEALGELPL